MQLVIMLRSIMTDGVTTGITDQQVGGAVNYKRVRAASYEDG